MSQCTAPVRGHIRGGGGDCPVHGGRGGYGYGHRNYYEPPRSIPTYPPEPVARVRSSGGSSGGGGGARRTARPSWQPAGSAVSYTPQQVRALQPVRTAAMERTQEHDVFLCHAWPDRRDDALELYNLLGAEDVSVWFSEASLMPGVDMRIAIERGLGSSRIGLVLVTPAMLEKLRSDRSVANAELSTLLRRNLLMPVLHGVTYEELEAVSPMLASRAGFSTGEDSIEEIAVKIAELVNSLADEALESVVV
jgi:hypothetical protein